VAGESADVDAPTVRLWDRLDRLSWLPRSVKRVVHRRVNAAYAQSMAQHLAKNDVDANTATRLPEGEFVHIPVIWLAEVFTPTTIDRLTAGVSRLIRKSDGTWPSHSEDPIAWIQASRRQGGGQWHNLVYVLPGKPRMLPPRTVLDELPPGIRSVHLMLQTVTPTVTVLTAAFRPDATRASGLHGILNKDFATRPEPLPDGSYAITDAWTQKARAVEEWRSALRSEAADWLASRFPGSVNRLAPGQVPAIELLVTGSYRPWDMVASPDEIPGWAEILDLGAWAATYWGSASPLRLNERATRWITPADRHVLVLAGLEREIAAVAGPGNNMSEAIALMDEQAGRLLTRWSLTVLLQELNEQTSAIQDAAERVGGRQSAHGLSEVQRQLLQGGIDSRIVANDIVRFAKSQWWNFNVLKFTEVAPASITAGKPPPAPKATSFSLIETLGLRMVADGERVAEQESDLREVLNTSAQLAAAAANIRLQRTAVVVAIISLVIAAIAVVVSLHQSGTPVAPVVHPSTSASPHHTSSR
jgi:hypothetical protein